ncbi:RNA polymerase sigma factor [Kamptonema formosum]|uniref:RNA polymerase sigma factor n=1 Tax=Kamptonema formosum TaxID=331992 RepID=UPI0008FBCB3E|nr:sigma factor [Oscillatoria sp. PCC 10802]
MFQTPTLSCYSGSIEYRRSHFWQLWERQREELYRCCLKRMGNSPTCAEDGLRQAMLKAWNKVQAGASPSANFKAWVSRLTRNLCIDIFRSQQ